MKFSKRQIVEFKSKKRSYITWRKNLKCSRIKEYFYNNDDRYNIKTFFPDKNLEYCQCHMYNIVVGDYQLGIKYVNEQGTYYMFLSANSYWAPPQEVAIGKAVGGKIYLICEHFPRTGYSINFKEIPEEYINKNERGFRPKSYNHSVFVMPNRIERNLEEITEEDVKCLKIAYDGIRAFSKLIEEVSE